MRSVLKHIIINIFEKKVRTAIFLLTIIISTMVLFIGLSLNNIISDTYAMMFKGAYGNSNIIITKASDDNNPFYKYEELDTTGISIEERIDMVHATGKSLLNGESTKVALIGVDFTNATQLDLVKPISNIDGFYLEGNSAIISQKTASTFQLSLGDSISVSIHDKSNIYTIGAISETNGIFHSEINSVLLIVAVDQINDSYGLKNNFTSTLIKVPEESLDEAINTLTAAQPNFFMQKTRSAGTSLRDEKTFNITMMLAIIIIVLISAYVISSLSKIIVSERMPVVGTFRSVGISKRMMNGILSVEFLIYGLLGAVIGIGLAFALLPTIADIFNEYKEFGVKTNVNYHVGYMLLSLIFGISFPACVSIIHILYANSKPLKEIILNTSHTKQKRSLMPVIVGVLSFVASFVLYFMNLKDNLLMGLISTLLLFIAIILMTPAFLNLLVKIFSALLKRVANGEMILGIKNVSNNKMVGNNSSMIIVVFILLMMIGITSAGLDDYISNSLKKDYDVVITDLDKDPSEYADIEQAFGVADYQVQYISAAQYQIKGDFDHFSVYGVEDFEVFDEFYSGVNFLSDSKTRIANDTNGVIIDEYQAERYSLNVGDAIQLQPLDSQFRPLSGEGTYIEFVVSGIMESSGFTSNRSAVLINANDFKEHFEGLLNQIVIKVRSGVDAESVESGIVEKYFESDITVYTFEKMIAGQKATVDTLINGIQMIIIMGMIVGLLGITNNLIVSFIQRKKEFAILYSVCMSKFQVIKMLFFEMIMTFMSVVIIGCLGGLAMNVVMSKLLYAIGLRLDFSFDFGLFGILSAVVFVLLALSTLIIVRKVARINVLQELRYE